MTREEFAGWQSLVYVARGAWIVDAIHHGLNGKDLLIHKGSHQEGVYIRIDRGVLSAGRYRDAFPHIGKAEFIEVFSKVFATNDEAYHQAADRLGIPFLRDLSSLSRASFIPNVTVPRTVLPLPRSSSARRVR